MAAGEVQALQAHLARAQEAADKQTVQCQQEVAAAQQERSSLAAELAVSEARNQQLSAQLLQLKGHSQELQQCRASDISAQAHGHQATAGGGINAEGSQQLVRPEGEYTHAFAACSHRLTDIPAGWPTLPGSLLALRQLLTEASAFLSLHGCGDLLERMQTQLPAAFILLMCCHLCLIQLACMPH